MQLNLQETSIRHRLKPGYRVGAWFAVLFAWAGSGTVKAQTAIPPDHSGILYFGRFDQGDRKNPRFDWPGVSISASFTGTSCSIASTESGGGNNYDVFIDGRKKSTLVTANGAKTYLLADGLPDQTHALVLGKRTEASAGMATFRGLILCAQKTLAPAAKPPYRTQIIGDSYSAG